MPPHLISVVIPTYNQAGLLERALGSALAQTHRSLEVVVVDDGSTDGTASYLAGVGDARLKVVLRPHTGNTAAIRNAGIEVAGGGWIAFLDSDDHWLPTKLERQLRGLRANPASRWSFTDFSMVDEIGHALPRVPAPSARAPAVPVAGRVRRRLLAYVLAAPLPSLLVERHLLDEVGWLDDGLYHDDFDLTLRLAAASPALCLPEPLLVIRKDRARRWTVSDSLHHHQQMGAVLAKHLKVADSAPVRALCRAQRAHHFFLTARAHAGLGYYRNAGRDAFLSLLCAPNLLYLWSFRRSASRRVPGASATV